MCKGHKSPAEGGGLTRSRKGYQLWSNCCELWLSRTNEVTEKVGAVKVYIFKISEKIGHYSNLVKSNLINNQYINKGQFEGDIIRLL